MGAPKLRDVSAQKLHVMLLDADPEKAFSDIALATLVRDGWTLFTQFAADFGPGGGERIVLVLAPPRPDDAAEEMAALTEQLRATSEAASALPWYRWRALALYLVPCLLLAVQVIVLLTRV